MNTSLTVGRKCYNRVVRYGCQLFFMDLLYSGMVMNITSTKTHVNRATPAKQYGVSWNELRDMEPQDRLQRVEQESQRVEAEIAQQKALQKKAHKTALWSMAPMFGGLLANGVASMVMDSVPVGLRVAALGTWGVGMAGFAGGLWVRDIKTDTAIRDLGITRMELSYQQRFAERQMKEA